MESFKERFDNVIIDKLAVDKEQITPESRFKKDLGADSLDMVELAMQFENQFEISIPDEDVRKIKTVDDAEKYIRNILNRKQVK
ncbi:MAG TPA: acyl carrier protein [Bacteroidia bacterium]|nr:acyl carrier protein [Bacteroidia bacterium]